MHNPLNIRYGQGQWWLTLDEDTIVYIYNVTTRGLLDVQTFGWWREERYYGDNLIFRAEGIFRPDDEGSGLNILLHISDVETIRSGTPINTDFQFVKRIALNLRQNTFGLPRDINNLQGV